MSERYNVEGILNLGGTTNVDRSAIGPGATAFNTSHPSAQPHADRPADTPACDVGIITVLNEETQAVIRALDLRHQQAGGLHFYERKTLANSAPATLVAIQALSPGKGAALAAYHNLCQHYSPRIVVLAGIAGGIRPDIHVGDVVVATRVIYYDLRRVAPTGIQHRGEEHRAPAETSHGINAFFAEHDPAEFRVEDPEGTSRLMRMRAGIIGSGEAVIADNRTEILAYLASFNDKILAVDTESAGLSQACHEHLTAHRRPRGWVIIRGISDKADCEKNDTFHRVASWHAAVALRRLLPYL